MLENRSSAEGRCLKWRWHFGCCWKPVSTHYRAVGENRTVWLLLEMGQSPRRVNQRKQYYISLFWSFPEFICNLNFTSLSPCLHKIKAKTRQTWTQMCTAFAFFFFTSSTRRWPSSFLLASRTRKEAEGGSEGWLSKSPSRMISSGIKAMPFNSLPGLFMESKRIHYRR